MIALERIRSCIILDGSARRRPFLEAVGRSGLDLPVDDGITVADLWLREIQQIAPMHEPGFSCRIVVDRRTPLPCLSEPPSGLSVQVERDPEPWRGTGGVLRDLSSEYAADDYVVVVSGVQIPLNSLWSLLEPLADLHADVAMAVHEDGTSAGVKLIRCGALQCLAPVGYVDFKEQGLAKIAKEHSVRVTHRPDPICLGIRGRAEYLTALRHWHSQKVAPGNGQNYDALDEGWSVFALIEEGAEVHAEAELMNSVVLAGARVDRRAEVIDSVICSGQRVNSRESIVGAVLSQEIARAVQST